MTGSPGTTLTPFQLTVAAVFFSLPESDGFLLAGGAALAAQGLVTRPTQDLDLFTRAGATTVSAARDAFMDAATDRNWSVRCVRDGATFCRLVVAGDEELLVDLALDSPPTIPPAASVAGPTFGLEELAARKVLALFGRAEARDFADVYVLADRFGVERLLDRARQLDAGFDEDILAAMFGFLDRFDDGEIPISADSVSDLRLFFRTWRDTLSANGSD